MLPVTGMAAFVFRINVIIGLVTVGAQYLDVTHIRLVNGSGPYSGRVELSINGIWGTVCDDSFDMNDAKVMCNMLNLKASTFVKGGYYGQASGPIYAQQFYCSGYESTLSSCRYQTNAECNHSQDIAIICTECGEISTAHGKSTISADGKSLSNTCDEGFSRADPVTSKCQNGTWTVKSLACSALAISSVRLHGGSGLADGTMQMMVNGTWGTMCNTTNRYATGNVFCRMLGFPGRYSSFGTSRKYISGDGPVFLKNVDCTGTENHINECSYEVTNTCSDFQVITQRCYVGKWNITDIRLADGVGPYSGRVELFVKGYWGTICKSHSPAHSNGYHYAETVCRMMNLSLTTVFDSPIYGQGEYPVLLYNLVCDESDYHINDCYYDTGSCTNSQDLTLICTPCGIPPNIDESSITFNGKESMSVSCYAGFAPSQMTLRCQDDSSWDKRCSAILSYPLNITEIRLVDFYDYSIPSEGRVRLLVNGQWGGICGNMFDRNDAEVICRMLGMSYQSYSLSNGGNHNGEFGLDKVPIYVDNLECLGNESHINQCTYDVDNNCTYWNDVAVRCTGYQLNVTEIRLSGTNSPYSGRVEVLVNETWGTVCGSYFGWSEATLVCQMQGFGRVNTYYPTAYPGAGSVPTYIDRLRCSYPYDHINQCKYAPNNYYNCTHSNDESVTCYGPPLEITGARLVNGSGPDEGRAEINVNGVWGTICDQNFNILAADLFCQMINMRAIKYYTGATHGPGTGPVYMEQMFCNIYDNKLSDCDYLHLNTCNHQRDVSVVCSACGQPDLSSWDVNYFQYNGSELYADCSYYKTYVGILRMKCNNVTGQWYIEGECIEYSYPLDIQDIRLAGGTNRSSGRVELKAFDTWGTVCSDSFGISEAETVCRMIGYPPALSFTVGTFGPGSGPIFVDDLSCDDDSSHIDNCTYITHDNCQHTDDVYVTCTDCGSPVPLSGQANSTSSRVGSVVRLFCDSGYRLTGEDTLTCLSNVKWSATVPSCVFIDCGDPTPENGRSNSTATSNGTVVAVSCVPGYYIVGDAVIECQENDTWTDNPICEIEDCGPPMPLNAYVELPSNRTTHGELAVITCKEGYRPKGSTTITCLTNSTWEKWPACKVVDCKDPTPTKGFVNSTDTVFGVVVEVSCDEGLNITGPHVIICQADGSWSGSPICDPSDCGKLQLPNGDIQAPDGTAFGTMAFASCDPGYDLTGSSVVFCTDQGWNSTLTCKKQDCGDPSPENGIRTDNGGTLFGDTAKITCVEGYKMNGDKVITCQDSGIWSETTTCVLKDCGSVDIPANGAMFDIEGTKYGASISFSCLSGYLLVGSSVILCESTGAWSDDPPQCVEKSRLGGVCQGNEYCLAGGAVCRNSVCTCITGIHDEKTNTCDAMPLLPYGPDENDHVVPKSSSCGPAIKFAPGIPLFSKMYTDIFVCHSGYITFDSLYTNPTPPTDSSDASITLNTETILAPFYANIDISNSGPLYYRTYNILNSYSKMKQDAQLISYIESVVEKFEAVTDFETSFLLIASWTETVCITDDLSTSNKATSTFQVIVASDGRNTYALNIYGQGQMNWADDINTSNGHCDDVFIGYNVDSISYTYPFSFSQVVLELDQRLGKEVTSELDVAGLVFRAMTSPENVHNNPAVDCIKWFNNGKADRNDLDYIASLMPECPCNIRLSRFDPWFWQIGLERWRRDERFVCVDMLPTGSFGQYGKSCCYDSRTQSWVYERPHAGGFKLYHPEKNYAENFVSDVLPKNYCCVDSNYCDLYYKLRPSGSCYRSSPYNYGTFWGDPHFRTLDGLSFTFNGLGEFTMLQICTDNVTFDLQARTERALKQDGNLSDATVFSVFAAKDSSNASVHVEMNTNKTGLNIFVNKVDMTTSFNTDTVEDQFEFSAAEGNLYLAKREGAVYILFPLSGISLNISTMVGMLILSTVVPQTWLNSTGNIRGLLGNYDGDPSNDFVLPNGTFLPANITERQIFDYGMMWSIEEENSTFVYEEGKSHSHYHNASYVPQFLTDADPYKRQEAEILCGGPENIECIFDYVFTGRVEVAEATAAIRHQVDSDQESLETSVPDLVGCNTTRVTTGQTVTCVIEYDSNDNIEFVENNVGAKFDEEKSTITYIQMTDKPVDIRIVSTNAESSSSPVFRLNIELCTGCNGHGNCTEEIREDNRSTEYFKYLVCQCEPEFEGGDCERVFDGCATSPCSHDRVCIGLSAEDQKLLGRAFSCSACPVGYQDDQNLCKDINECTGTNPCEHMCNNTYGSFVCTCHSGYRVDPADTHRCEDVNECDEALHNCSQLCNNIEGSFECACHAGYYFNASSWMCQENEEPLCNTTALERCANTSGCTLDKNEDDFCFCDAGFELDESGTSCRDVNECERNLCSHKCNNTVGGFLCSCYTGYGLVGLTTCQECEIPFWGESCGNICLCTGRGAERCDSFKGCICMNGWQGISCDDDINECDDVEDACTDPRKECVNTLGSYICECIDGYTVQENGSCGDINECASPILHDCSQTCTNMVGGYSCSCNIGFTEVNRTCKDIDECSLGLHHCQQRCVNSPGSYSCFCNSGYTLNDDRHTCEAHENLCSVERNFTCEHYCLMDGNSLECGCYDGYNLAADNQTCTDANECENDQLNQCDATASCVNTKGSYFCICPIGRKLENNNRTCTECDGFHFGVNCSQTCSCVHGTCDKIQGCQCDTGWAADQCDLDLDECASGRLLCSGANSVCMNTLGGAKCSCRPGFVNISGVCTDLNECDDSSENSCDQICINTMGSFRCECHTGFETDEEAMCKDVNECTGQHGCSQLCVNNVGSYRCSCFEGYKLDLTDRRTCTPVIECSLEHASLCGENSSCTMSTREPICTCLKGFQNQSETCQDVDECLRSPAPCSQICNNSVGGFVCSCHPGFTLRDDLTTCQECDDLKFGTNCEMNCSCNDTNTESCDFVSGVCMCRAGWQGATCNEDIDECLVNSICPENSNCRNTQGEYLCDCNIGYFASGSGLCTECDSRHFGLQCSEICKCDVQNTADCDSLNGSCICNQGWTGENCTQDANECVFSLGICREKNNSHCENTEGSYICECNNGFLEIDGTCTDIDECSERTDGCLNACYNTDGSYFCGCHPGYSSVDNGTVCEECKGNRFGFNCSLECNCNTANANNSEQTCNKVTGECVCNAFWTGTTCDDDVNECDALGMCNTSNLEVCVNTVGSFRCDCLRGYTEVSDRICVEAAESTTLSSGDLVINLTVTLDYTLPSSANLNSSVVYTETRSAINNSLTQFYARFIEDTVQVIIWDIRRGSLVVDYSVVAIQSDEMAVQLLESTSALARGTIVTFDGINVTATTDTYRGSKLCSLYEDLVGTCGNGLHCVVSNHQPSCILDDDDENWPFIVGMSVGGFILIVVLAAVVFWCLQVKNRDSRKTRPAWISDRETSSECRGVANIKYGQWGKHVSVTNVKAVDPYRKDVYTGEPEKIEI